MNRVQPDLLTNRTGAGTIIRIEDALRRWRRAMHDLVLEAHANPDHQQGPDRDFHAWKVMHG